MLNPNSSSSSSADELATASIFVLPLDIIETNILTRLDGPALACVGSTCSTLRALSAKEHLWAKICHSTWPSTNTPRVRELISSFPRSFFTDSFLTATAVDHRSRHPNLDQMQQLIFAVDLFHHGQPILSRVVEEESVSKWFRSWRLSFNLLHWNERVPTGIARYSGDMDLTLSWIVTDPRQRRTVNVSNWKPVWVLVDLGTGELEVHFGTMMGGGEWEEALCCITVRVGRNMEVRQVSFQMEDMEGRDLPNSQCLGILHRVLQGERKRVINNGRVEDEELLQKIKECSLRRWNVDL